MSFTSLGLSAPILDALSEQGYGKPTPIQAKAIPAVLEGKDVMGAAQTGTGKTAGFTLPILEILSKGDHAKSNQVRALILTPTRELAAQVGNSVSTYGKNLALRSTVVFGGVKINPQMKILRKGVDILVATPGRLLDLYGQNTVKFNQLEILVLDEADRMLDMGFIRDIKKILALLPKNRQSLMFSATFSDDIRKLAKGLVRSPTEISVSPRNTTVQTINQWICPVGKKRKPALLTHLIKDNDWKQVLVFSKTKHGANRLARHLDGKGIKSLAIHGNKSQSQRTKALADFKNGSAPVLVATDIAARGIDINQLPRVVNFDLPHVPEDYIHRIGRTGRAGLGGEAVSLVSADEAKQLSDIERLLQRQLPRTGIDGFEVDHDLPTSSLERKPLKSGKQKKPKNKSRAKQRNSGQRNGEQRTEENTNNGRPNKKTPWMGKKKTAHSKKTASSGNNQRKPNSNPKARCQHTESFACV